MVKPGQLTAKQKSFIERYCNPKSDTYNNGMQSAIAAGYADTTAKNADQLILDNMCVQEGIAAYTAENKAVLEHNRQLAIDILHEALAIARAKKDNMGIVSACRELDAISNLHKQVIEHKGTQGPQVDSEEKAALTDLARQYKIKLAKEAG